MRVLPCGHNCCGVRGEPRCLPCLEPHCRASAATVVAGSSLADGWHTPAGIKASGPGDSCCLCWEELGGGGCIVLQCGHLVHLACAQDRLKVRMLLLLLLLLLLLTRHVWALEVLWRTWPGAWKVQLCAKRGWGTIASASHVVAW
jgi:hypothetical protein